MCAAQVVKAADLEPELREALARDAACDKAGGSAATSAAPVQAGESEFNTQTFHGAGGRLTGVIAVPTGGCQCQQGNCTTLVYVKSGPSYTLVLKEKLATLRTMRVYKNGLPSLTGKFQVSPARAETKVFDWNGNRYQATLCATVTQTSNPRRPAIVKHECAKPVVADQP